jgi:hypothetical protein
MNNIPTGINRKASFKRYLINIENSNDLFIQKNESKRIFGTNLTNCPNKVSLIKKQKMGKKNEK